MTADRPATTHTPGRGIGRNAVINVLGITLPAVAALGAIPFLVTELGRERFGLLTLAWAVLGWFSLFDAGLGRATTHLVAAKNAERKPESVRGVALLTIGLLLALGVIGGVIAAIVTPWLVEDVLRLSPELRGEATTSFLILAATLPFLLASAGARGVLEGNDRFGLVNAIRIPASLLLFTGPLAVLPFTHDLRVIVAVIAATRVGAFIAFMLAARGDIPEARAGRSISRDLVKMTLSYAGWAGLTNALGAVIALGYLDRFLIGGLVSVADVAYYATPLEVATKLWLLPIAIMGVLFPALTRAHIAAPDGLSRLYSRGLKAVALPLAPVTLALVASAGALLGAWVGMDFANAGTRVAQLLLLGAFCNALAQVPFTVLQAVGRADVTALRHLVQLPVYVALSYFATKRYGIEGTAFVWFAWASTDMLVVFWLAHRIVPTLRLEVSWKVAAFAAPLVAASLLVSSVDDARVQVGCAAVLSLIAIGILWSELLDPLDRAAVLQFSRARLRASAS